MTQQPTIIFAGDAGWRLSCPGSSLEIPSSIGGTPKRIATEIASMLGSRTENATLALPASWCLSATVSLAGVPVRNRRTSLLYRLELLLPLSAEDVAADYILNQPNTALAICTSIATVKPFIEAIEAEGILIHSVLPASLFAASLLLASQQTSDLVVLESAKSIELFTGDNGKITGWYLIPGEVEDLRWHLDQLPANKDGARKAVVCNADSTLLDLLKTINSLQLVAVDHRSTEQLVSSAIAVGETSPVNLRQDGLAPSSPFRAIRRPLNEAILAALVLIACICGAACWRGFKLEQVAESDRAQQRKLFIQLFPGHAVPSNIVSRLKSEDRALGNSNINAANSPSQSALPVLQSVLAGIDGLPAQVRFQVDDLKVEDQKFSLDGIAKTRSDLTIIVDALQQTSRLKLEPPQTEQAAGKGLRISLNGSTTESPQLK